MSRSTLLYYDGIGLLCPAYRTRTKYRIYSESDHDRLEQICILRDTGISLSEIKIILDQSISNRAEILQKRLKSIQSEINTLREQQRHIVQLLECPKLLADLPMLSKEQWISILQSSGLDEAGMDRWHYEFEKSAPESHQSFLESLGLSEEEIDEIRQRYSG